jgi:hypothetical protein
MGKLAEAQFEVAMRWDRLAARYQQTIGTPRPDPYSPLIGVSGHGNGYGDADFNLEVDEAIVERFASAHSALALCGKAVEKTTRECVEASDDCQRDTWNSCSCGRASMRSPACGGCQAPE